MIIHGICVMRSMYSKFYQVYLLTLCIQLPIFFPIFLFIFFKLSDHLLLLDSRLKPILFNLWQAEPVSKLSDNETTFTTYSFTLFV